MEETIEESETKKEMVENLEVAETREMNGFEKSTRKNHKRKGNKQNKERRDKKSKRTFMKKREKGICQVCKEKEQKYKCPNCLIVYCSLECFKKHKSENRCEKKEEPIKKFVGKVVIEDTSVALQKVEDIDFVLLDTQKEALEKNEELRKKLRDIKLLREIVENIMSDNKSVNKSCDEIQKMCRMEPFFAKFVDEMLVTAGIRDKEGNCLL